MTAPWWADQPEPVRTLLDLAYELEPDTLTRAACLLGVRDHLLHAVASDLRWIDRLRADQPVEVLSDYYENHWRGINADAVAEQVADDLAADVLAWVRRIAATLHPVADVPVCETDTAGVA